METFLNIDWNFPIIINEDGKFISEEKLLKESVMHRMLDGSFKNPFDHMDGEYKAINIDMIQISDDSSEEEEDNATKLNEYRQKKKKTYIPGYGRLPDHFPISVLTAEEQHLCLKMIMKFSNNHQQSFLTNKDKIDLSTYRKIKNIINQEQSKFLTLVEKIWDENKWKKIYCEDSFKARWKCRLNYILSLPRYYLEETHVPFNLDKDITVKFLSTCLSKGEPAEIKFPTLTKRFRLDCNPEKLKNYLSMLNKPSDQPIYFKLPVSKDPTCESLAQENKVDLVISSSGLNCLASNIDSNNSKIWMLPVKVQYFEGKNIVYIDKPAPQVFASIPEKNYFAFKYLLRKAIFKCEPVSTRSDNVTVYDDDDIFGSLYSTDCLSYEQTYNSSTINSNDMKDKKDFENKSLNTEDVSEVKKSDYLNTENVSKVKKTDYLNTSKLKEEMDNIEEQSNTKIKSNTKPYSSNCVSYNLFKIGPSDKEQTKLMKNKIEEYKILVRIKEDGYEESTESKKQKLLLVPKLEHQTGFGGEAITLKEGLQQWISLVFRPATSIARVRISVKTAEIIQIQKCSSVTVRNEVQRLYNKKVNVSLIFLHNIIQTLSFAPPGNYIVARSTKEGSFAILYKEATAERHGLDLHTLYTSSECHTMPTFSWPKLDKLCITPLHEHLNRMPLMFVPRKGQKRKFEACTNTKSK